MQIDLTDQETALIKAALNTPVTISPGEMPGYLKLVYGIISKLNHQSGEETENADNTAGINDCEQGDADSKGSVGAN